MISNWPVHKNNEVVSVLAEAETDCHHLTYRQDGSISVCFDPELLNKVGVPENVREAAMIPGNMLFTTRGHRDAIRRMFDEADAREAREAS